MLEKDSRLHFWMHLNLILLLFNISQLDFQTHLPKNILFFVLPYKNFSSIIIFQDLQWSKQRAKTIVRNILYKSDKNKQVRISSITLIKPSSQTMYPQSSSVSKQKNPKRVVLSPIKKSKKRRLIEQKQKKFILDCTNCSKSKLQEYNYLKDKYLNYCVVKVPKRKRIVASSLTKSDKSKENSLFKDHQNFKSFLQNKKEQILAQTNMSMKFKSKQKSQNLNFDEAPIKQNLLTQKDLNKEICEDQTA